MPSGTGLRPSIWACGERREGARGVVAEEVEIVGMAAVASPWPGDGAVPALGGLWAGPHFGDGLDALNMLMPLEDGVGWVVMSWSGIARGSEASWWSGG